MGQLDLILGATQPITMTSADVTLTNAQWNNCAIKLTGTLTGNHNLILPLNQNSASVAVGGLFVVDNETSGAYAVTVITANTGGSIGVVVPQSARTWLYSDTQNVYYADDAKVQILTGSGNPNGNVAGTAGSINHPPSVYWDYTNAILYFCVTTGNAASAVWNTSQAAISRGFDTAVNLTLSCTHTGGNLLNVAVKTAAGGDPSAVSPVLCNFQTVSAGKTTGGVTSLSVSTALSINTNATGATLGSSNNVPFRFWIALFNNAGTAVVGIMNASTATNVYPLSEYGIASTVSISGAAASAGVWYTPNGTTLTNVAYRLIGYCEYTAGLVTAGTYTSDPTNAVVFGPGIKPAGAVVQTVTATATAGTTAPSSAFVQTNTNATITSTSTINPILVRASGSGIQSGGGIVGIRLSRGSGPTFITQSQLSLGSGYVAAEALDAPGTTAATTYYVYVNTANNGGSAQWIGVYAGIQLGSTMVLQELMG